MPIEYKLLLVLARKAEKVLRRSFLLNAIWGLHRKDDAVVSAILIGVPKPSAK